MIPRRFKTSLAVTAGVLGLFIAVCAVFAHGPDRDLSWEREVPLQTLPQDTRKAIWSIANWKRWIVSAADVRRVDLAGNAMPMKDQVVEKGALIEMKIDPRKGRHRKFDLLVQVTDFEPGKRVAMRLVKDSSGRLTQLFDGLDWEIELLPAQGPEPARLKGSERTRTRHWRSRVFSRLSERILMHQAYFPDLMKLSAITLPLDPVPSQPLGQ